MSAERQSCAGVAFTRPLRAEMRGDVPMPFMDSTGAVTRTIFSTISRGTELTSTWQFHSRRGHAAVSDARLHRGREVTGSATRSHIAPGVTQA